MQTPMCCFIYQKTAHQISFQTIFSIIFYGKVLTCHKVTDPLVCFNRHALSVGLKQHCYFIYYVIFIYIYIYFELAWHDEQNGGQSFNLRARIVKFW